MDGSEPTPAESAGFIRVDTCDLCRAKRITPWFHEDEICWIAECEICETPMVVWRTFSMLIANMFAIDVENARAAFPEVHMRVIYPSKGLPGARRALALCGPRADAVQASDHEPSVARLDLRGPTEH